MNPPAPLLVVDDHREDLMAIVEVLDQPEYEVVTATTGHDALRRVLERDFAAIVLDVMLPDLRGFEVAAIIKQRARSRHTPILFMTAAGADLPSVRQAYSVGAIDFLAKPFDPAVLAAKVAIFAELFVKDAQIQAQAEALRAADRRERDLALAELRLASQRRYRNLAEAVPHIVWTADPDGTVTYLNRRWTEYVGGEAAVGAGLLDAVHPDDVERYAAAWRDAVVAGGPFEVECRLRRADGSYRWHLGRTVPELDEQGGLVAWLGTFTDVDDRRRAFDEARAAIAARDAFLSIASHELRTPLMTLQLRLRDLVAAVDQLGSDGRCRALAAAAVRQGGRLTGLVDSLLDVSRITSGRLVIEREPLELSAVVREAIDRFAEAAERAGCAISFEAGRPVTGEWDRQRIEQIVDNLLDNAIKYAAGAPIEVEVTGDGDHARLSVRDHGRGIAAADRERVFDRFERAVSPRQYGGLGMGLYIAREIADAHGGSIRIDSARGQGATFVVSLPRAAPPP